MPAADRDFLKNTSNVELANLQGELHKRMEADDQREADSTIICDKCNFANDAGFTTCHQCAKVMNLKRGPDETDEQLVDRQTILEGTFIDETNSTLQAYGLKLELIEKRLPSRGVGHNATTKYLKERQKGLEYWRGLKRAEKATGVYYTTPVDRYWRDPIWQANMHKIGHNQHTIARLQYIAHLPGGDTMGYAKTKPERDAMLEKNFNAGRGFKVKNILQPGQVDTFPVSRNANYDKAAQVRTTGREDLPHSQAGGNALQATSAPSRPVTLTPRSEASGNATPAKHMPRTSK